MELKSFRSNLRLPPDAVGLAVFHNGSFQGLDLFDRHTTLQFFWESLLDSYAIDFLNARWGKDVVHVGVTHDVLASAPTRISFTQIPDLARDF